MNRLKASFICSLVLVLSISVSVVSAAETPKISHKTITIEIAGKDVIVDERLTASEIELLTADALSEIDIKEGPIVSVSQTKKVFFDPSESISQIDSFGSTMSILPTDTLLITVIAQRVEISGYSNYDCFRFTATALWDNEPNALLHDVMGLAWSDDFTLQSERCIITRSDGLTEYGTLKSIEPETGVGYDILMWYPTGQYTHVWAKKTKIIAYGYKLDSPGSANVVSNYAHEYFSLFGGSISISLLPTPSIGFSGSFGLYYDIAIPAYASFRY